jgi:hypothetical protein
MQRRRFKQTVPFQERLTMWARQLRQKAEALPPGPERSALLKRASQADTAIDIESAAGKLGAQPSK